MDKNTITEYIKKYKDSYSKNSIIEKLKEGGATDLEIQEAFSEVENSTKNTKQNDKTLLAFILVLIGFFIPIAGILLSIPGLIIAFKNRKTTSKPILSIITIILGILKVVIAIGLAISFIMFSMINQGNLTPDYISLNKNLQADSIASLVDSKNQEITIVFQYNGAKKTIINATSSETFIQTVLNEQCDGVSVRNTDTNDAPEPASTFLNGQTGVLKFSCDTSESNVLIQGDTVEGDISIALVNPNTGIITKSSGNIKLTSS